MDNTTKTLFRKQRYNHIIHELINFYKEPTVLLITHLHDVHGYSFDQIGKILGISKQAVHQVYGFEFPTKRKRAEKWNNLIF